MAASPVERIVRCTLLEVVGVALMVAERRKEGRLPQQVSFYAKEDWPQRTVIAISHEVARVNGEIGSAMLHQLRHDGRVHIVACTRVAIYDKTILAWSGWSRLEGALAVL